VPRLLEAVALAARGAERDTAGAMSEENVEIVREAIGAALRRPKPDWDRMNELFHPDHEFLSRFEKGLGGRVGRGAQGYRDWLAHTAEMIEWETRLGDVTNIDDERVLAMTPTKIRGRQSGAESEQPLASIVTVRDGKVVRTEAFGSKDEALKAAGLSE
jgi:ketosteroid isomerase-like protein